MEYPQDITYFLRFFALFTQFCMFSQNASRFLSCGRRLSAVWQVSFRSLPIHIVDELVKTQNRPGRLCRPGQNLTGHKISDTAYQISAAITCAGP